MSNDPLSDSEQGSTATDDGTNSPDGDDSETNPGEETEPDTDEEKDEEGGLIGRRTVLAGFLASLVAILSALALNPDAVRGFFEPTHENAGQGAWLERDTEEMDTEEAVTGTVRLEGGQYTAQQLWARSAGVELSWAVSNLNGGTVDVWVLPDDHIDRYQDEEEPRFVEELSESGIRSDGDASGEVVDGDWWLVLDNSDLYGSGADDEVEFDVEMRIRG